jgi:hypothetical protein
LRVFFINQTARHQGGNPHFDVLLEYIPSKEPEKQKCLADFRAGGRGSRNPGIGTSITAVVQSYGKK